MKKFSLFLLQKDPMELNNIYNGPAYTQIQVKLKKQLNLLVEKYKDDEIVKMNLDK